MAAAAAQRVSPSEFVPVAAAPEMPPRPALELVPDKCRKRLLCRWRFDPAQQRLVATWEQQSL